MHNQDISRGRHCPIDRLKRCIDREGSLPQLPVRASYLEPVERYVIESFYIQPLLKKPSEPINRHIRDYSDQRVHRLYRHLTASSAGKYNPD